MIYQLTLLHCPARLWAESLAIHEPLQTLQGKKKFAMLHHYPVDKEANRTQLIMLAEKYGYEVIEPQKNLGLHVGLNWAVQKIGIKESDILLGIDPARTIETLGWDSALVTAIMHPMIGWAALCNHASLDELSHRPHRIINANGLRVAVCLNPMMLQTSAFKMDWVLQNGGFREPCAYYGFLETEMFRALRRKHELGILLDFKENGRIAEKQDLIYAAWKRDHVAGKFKGNFDQYLEEKSCT
jgi:hypothetical protein